ncbi:MAG: tRNA (guanosine(37)-N1)-methyltransferase TrmD [bacterium]
MKFDIITIFPQIFDSYFSESILGRAQKTNKIEIKTHNLRDYTKDKHNKVDDKPYGGGVGMVFQMEPIYRALKSIKALKSTKHHCRDALQCVSTKVILFSAKGKKFDQETAQRLSKLKRAVLICGRYEGIDERVKEFIDEEISIGDYVLTGGEIPAMVIVDSVSRLIPGVLGKDESSKDESHSKKGWLEYPHYTRPAEFKIGSKKLKVPKVLLSGDHKKIKKWRESKAKQK